MILRQFILAVVLIAGAGPSAVAQTPPPAAPAPVAEPSAPALDQGAGGVATEPTASDAAGAEEPAADETPEPPVAATSGETTPQVVDFTVPAAMLNLNGALSDNRVSDPAHPGAVWFTVAIKNDGVVPVSRILEADDPPSAGLAFLPQASRPLLREAAASDSSVVIERANAFGRFAFRVTLPPAHTATLALHFEGVANRPSLLAWTESALVAHNRRAATLMGVVGGLLAAAAAFALGAATLSGRAFDKWAGLFLAGLLFVDMVASKVFDDGWFTALGGPYGLLALALSLTIAAGARLLDRIAPFAEFHPLLGRWRDIALLGLIALGLAAALGIPATGLLVRLASVVGAGAAAGYLAHYGRLGVPGSRHLAPAATVFALVTAAATFHALGLFPPNLIAPAAIGGFAAAGAMLVALACVLPEAGAPAASAVRPMAMLEMDEDDDLPPPEPERVRLFEKATPRQAPSIVTASSARERDAMAASHQGVFDLDLATSLLTLSAEGAAILGLPEGGTELPRETWTSRIHPDDRGVYEEALRTYRHEPGAAFRLEFRARGADDKTHWFELRATMTGQATEAERCLGLIADITARKLSEVETAEAARNDVLTGLGNRIALLERLEDAAGNLAGLSLMVFDIDRFKAVNASLGQQGADRVLQAAVRRLQKHFGRDADLFRVGGVTFAILCERPMEDLRAWGEAAVARMTEPFILAGREIFLAASVGVAAGGDADEPLELLNLAEIAMVQAKRDGGARAWVYSPALGEAAEVSGDPVALEADLRRAMDRGEIEIHYQPIIRLLDNSLAGFEALLRWRHPERGTLAPDSFVGHSEETGLIRPLGRLALKHATEDLARWQQFFPLNPPLFVSVNVSWRQIAEDVFLRDLEAVLRRSGLPAGSLKLEMTESAMMEDVDAAERVLNRLDSLGIGLAIDDFGTGHSSLAQLKRFPFHIIKIDRSFLIASQTGGGKTILNSIVGMAHDLGLEIVAEGVEDERDARRLRDLGCAFAQGYFFGVAIPANEVTSYIAMTFARGDLSAAGFRD